jgi:hypothetical protein
VLQVLLHVLPLPNRHARCCRRLQGSSQSAWLCPRQNLLLQLPGLRLLPARLQQQDEVPLARLQRSYVALRHSADLLLLLPLLLVQPLAGLRLLPQQQHQQQQAVSRQEQTGASQQELTPKAPDYAAAAAAAASAAADPAAGKAEAAAC